MAIRNILKEKDPALKKKSREILEFNERLHVLLDDMKETLFDANGLGLAAPQVGVLRRAVLIVEITENAEQPEERIIELINPEIIEESGELSSNEGCLSVPGVYGIVSRPENVKVKALDRFGNEFELSCSGLTARAACHEIDHLNGIIFTSIAERILTEEELRDSQSKEENAQKEEQ